MAACQFFVIFVGSIIIGALFALFVAYLLKRQSIVKKQEVDAGD